MPFLPRFRNWLFLLLLASPMANSQVKAVSTWDGLKALYDQSFPPKAEFTEADVPDLSGKVAIVTGGAVGIGRETVRILLEHNAKVYIATRNEAKSRKTIQELKTLTGKDAYFLHLDLADIKQAKQAALTFAEDESSLHILFNNAGVMDPPAGSKTADNLELQWGTNVVGHFVFTETLIPLLRDTAKRSPPDTVRIVTTSSSAHMFAPSVGVDVEDISSSRGFVLYGQSKLGNVIEADYWAKKLAADNIISVSLNPGNISSELQRHYPRILQIIAQYFLATTAKGAITQIYGGTSPKITQALSGSYLIPWARISEPKHSVAYDEEKKEKVIELIKSQAGL